MADRRELQPQVEPLYGCGGYYVKGHVDRDAFHHAVRDQYGTWVPPQGVEHVWWRCVPDNSDEYGMRFDRAVPHSRGAWPATFTYHDRPRCNYCPACAGIVQRRCDEQNRVTMRKGLKRIWQRASEGEPLWLEIEDESPDGKEWTYVNVCSSRHVRSAA